MSEWTRSRSWKERCLDRLLLKELKLWAEENRQKGLPEFTSKKAEGVKMLVNSCVRFCTEPYIVCEAAPPTLRLGARESWSAGQGNAPCTAAAAAGTSSSPRGGNSGSKSVDLRHEQQHSTLRLLVWPTAWNTTATHNHYLHSIISWTGKHYNRLPFSLAQS